MRSKIGPIYRPHRLKILTTPLNNVLPDMDLLIMLISVPWEIFKIILQVEAEPTRDCTY